jgi:hypothetical protein
LDGHVDISIIVPVYNTEKYLVECLDSLAAQSFTRFEVLCVDDNSTDGSLELLRTYARRDQRFTVLQQEEGRAGPGSARNLALSRASGRYVAFVDSDDHVDPDFLRVLHDVAEPTGADIVMCTISKFSDEGSNEKYGDCTYDLHIPPELDDRAFTWRELEDPFRLRFIAWNKLYRRTFVEEHGIRFSEGIFFEDMLFTFRALFLAEHLRFVRRPLIQNRRQRQGATTYEQSDRMVGALTAFEQVELFLSSHAQFHDILPRFAAFRFGKMTEYLHRNDAAHMPQFWKALQDYAEEPVLDDNPHLSERQTQVREVIRTSDLFGFLAWEIWATKVRHAKVRRQRNRLKAQNELLRQRLEATRARLEQELQQTRFRARARRKVRHVLSRARDRIASSSSP